MDGSVRAPAGSTRKRRSGIPPGRPVGVPNKFTSAIRSAFEHAFADLQSHIPKRGEEDFRLVAWAKKNPKDFYKLMARMVPQEIGGPGGGAIPFGFSGSVVLYLPDNHRVADNAADALQTAPKRRDAR